MRKLFCVLALMTAGAPAIARDPLVRVEPPSPHVGKEWKEVRGDQLNFRERLEEWGVKVEPKIGGKAEDSGCETKLEVKWTGPDEITMELGFRSPAKVDGFDAEGKYILKVKPEEIGQGASGAFGFGSGKVGGEVVLATDTPFAAKMAGEIKRGLAALKLEGNNKLEAGLELEFDVGTANVKVDPVKYVRRFAAFVPKFIDASKKPAGAALDELARVRFNPGLMAAAIANDVTAWIKQMQMEKRACEEARKNLIESMVIPLKREQEFRRQQTQEIELALSSVDKVAAEIAKAGQERRAAWTAFANKPAVRPLPPVRAQDVDAFVGESQGYSGGGGYERIERDSAPREREFQFNSPTFNYLKSGSFGKGL
jgi:hypothetical protein